MIDLGDLEADRRALDGAPSPRPLPRVEEAISQVALLPRDGPPVLLPIPATEDARLLDALARLVRFAVMLGEPILAVAERYGGEYERALAREGRLPRWAIEGVREPLPPSLAILGPRGEDRP